MVRRNNNNMSEGIPLTFYTDDTYSPALKRLMQKVAKRLELSLNEEFWENLYSYTETYCFRAQNRRWMSRAGNDKEDVVISEAEGHAANPGVPEESMDEPTHTALLEDEDKPMCTGLLKDEDIHEDEASYAQSKDEDTHEDKAESSAATVSNMSEDLFDMCLDTLGTTAAICVPPVGTGAAIRDAPVGTTAICDAPVGTTAICDVPIGTTSAIHNAPVSTTTAAHHSLPVVTHAMTLAPKRPHPGSKCVDEPATKRVAINPLAASTDMRDQELDVILADYPDKRPAMTSRMMKLAIALYAETPDVGCITKLLNTLDQTRAPAHDRVLVQTCAPRVGPARPVTLKDISKAVGNGIAVMNLVQAFEYVLWVAKWEVALKKHYPSQNYLFMEMLPVVDIAHGQHDGQTIYKLTGPLMQQANYATKYNKAANEMMGEKLTKGAYGGFNRQLATAKVFVYIALMGRGKFDRICCQTLNKSTLRDLLPIVLQDYKLFQFVVKKANVNYNCARLGIKDAQTWGAVCDLACHTGSTMFVDIVKQDKAVEDMMDRFVKNLL